MGTNLREQAAVLALTKATSGEWYRTACLISDAGSAQAVLDGRIAALAEEQQRLAAELVDKVKDGDVDRAEAVITRVADAGARLITILDEDYPINLHQIYNRPPFLFVKGALSRTDTKSIAIVGTRKATPEGLEQADRLGRALSSAGVTVLSGLAKGIDTAAHRAALDAHGRTVSVIGAGVLAPTYPKENAGLAEEIVRSGAVVSQFWPDAPPTRYSFPMRNVVMSGMAVGTVVIEASATSGAKMQARLAMEHGKRLFLLERLVTEQEWAQRYAAKPGVTVVRDVDDILQVLVSLCSPTQQMAFAL